MEEDPVLRKIGNFGKWQFMKISIFGLGPILSAWQMLAVSFLLPETEFWCSPAGLQISLGESLNWTSPIDKDNNRPNACEMFDLDYKISTLPSEVNHTKVTACSRWDFSREVYPESVVSEFHLVCDNDRWRSLSQSIYMGGYMMGAVGSGVFSDMFGRKKMTFLAALGLVASGIGAAFSPNMAVFTLLRCFAAFFSSSSYTCGYVYCMEIIGGSWSTYVGVGYTFPWAVGYITMPLLSILFPSWSHLQLATTIPSIVFAVLLGVPTLVPESPRWLLAQGRTELAEEILTKASETNKKMTLAIETVTARDEKNGKSAHFLDLFRTPGLRRSTLIMYYAWFTNSFVYYGLALNSGNLIPGDLHTNFAISGALEVLAYILTILVLLKAGRRISVSACMLLGGTTLVMTALVSSTMGKMVLAQLGKFAITGSFAMVYVYAAEIFPTVVRNMGIGSSSMCARVGSILAPYIGREVGRSSPTTSIIIFGVTSIIAGVLVLLLPETRNSRLPDTMEEGEQFAIKFGGIRGLWKKKERM